MMKQSSKSTVLAFSLLSLAAASAFAETGTQFSQNDKLFQLTEVTSPSQLQAAETTPAKCVAGACGATKKKVQGTNSSTTVAPATVKKEKATPAKCGVGACGATKKK